MEMMIQSASDSPRNGNKWFLKNTIIIIIMQCDIVYTVYIHYIHIYKIYIVYRIRCGRMAYPIGRTALHSVQFEVRQIADVKVFER